MARILYVFPHPDDESFGPGPGMARQRRCGHEVYLLTLTRGEATRERARYGYTKAEMGAVRYREMQAVAEVLDLTDLTVLDFPDGTLAELDPRLLEAAVQQHVERVRPHVVVTYPVHGISGHPDHLVTHAVVKRVYCEGRARGTSLRRLAFFTLFEDGGAGRPAHLQGSPREAIDCIVPVGEADRQQGEAALACYVTYQAVVQAHDPLAQVAGGIPFELFQEHPRPRLRDLCEGLEDNPPRPAPGTAP
ncbi:GlcNAc-PI de-N-acetylase [Rhodothermaceae bacterium RA]|nr:GlcNAc-PI de-N-acetylase [Rhodothermaceae bacterium RA]